MPQNVAGNYWLSDNIENKERKLVNIEARDGIWFANSNSNAQIYVLPKDSSDTQWIRIDDCIALKEYEFYRVELQDTRKNASIILLASS